MKQPASALRARLWALSVCLWLDGCTGYDPGAPHASDSDFSREMEEVLGTESGNPSEPSELGTESGNPGATLPVDEPEPDVEEQGTESGNPTRPPPAPVVAPEVPVTADPVDEPIDAPSPESTDVEPDDSVSVPAGATDAPAVPTMTTAPGDGVVPGVGTAGAMGCEAYTCQATAEAVAASHATAEPAPEAFASSTCNEAGACVCASATGMGTVTLAVAPSGEDACLVEGRLGCVYSASQFPGCDARVADACAVACGDVHLAMTEDAMGLAVDVRASACTSYGCRYVLEVGERCFLSGDALVPEPVDCATADASLGSP